MHVSINLLTVVRPSLARLRRSRRRRRAYAPKNNTTSHDSHEKINSMVFFFPYKDMGLRCNCAVCFYSNLFALEHSVTNAISYYIMGLLLSVK